MTKKILLLIFLAFLIIIPAGKVGATTAQYFVGVTIASAQAPGYNSGTTDNNWCLLYGTNLYIRDNNGNNLTAISPTTNPVPISAPGCAGTTIWSGLFNLTSGTTYQVYIVPGENVSDGNYYFAYCSGWNTDWRCFTSWNTSGQNKSCDDVCSHHASVASTDDTQGDCSVEAFLMGGTCATCTATSNYNYYNPSTNDCYYTTSGGASTSATLGSSLVRVCYCNTNWNYNSPNFTFSFTPSF